MKREKSGMGLIYFLIFVIIILVIALAYVIIDSLPEKNTKTTSGTIEKLEVEPYPTVNTECTFDVTRAEYQALTAAGCTGGYTRYNITDIVINEVPINVSVIYSDTKQVKTGLFINDVKMTSTVDSISNFKFGIFDSKLFVYDTNNNEANALAFNSKGKKVYDLKEVLEKSKIKDLSTGDTNIKANTLNPNSFRFNEGSIEFDSVSNNCQNGETSSGSHYKVVYEGTKFEKPEFMNLVNCVR